MASSPYGDLTRHPQRNIVLLGFHCAGKTSVGRALARRMRRPFIDWDAEIARRLPGSWRSLWPRGTERHFDREAIEARLISDLGYRRETIIALGAEAAGVEEYLRELRDFALLVHLDAPFEALMQRAASGNCLGAADGAELAALRSRYQVLAPHFAQAELCIMNSELSVERCAALIIHCFYT